MLGGYHYAAQAVPLAPPTHVYAPAPWPPQFKIGSYSTAQACRFVATLFTTKSHGHCTCTRRSWISQRYSCTHVHIIWYEVGSDHAHFAASTTRPNVLSYSQKFSRLKIFAGYDCTTKILSPRIFYACMQYIYVRGHLPVRARTIADVYRMYASAYRL